MALHNGPISNGGLEGSYFWASSVSGANSGDRSDLHTGPGTIYFPATWSYDVNMELAFQVYGQAPCGAGGDDDDEGEHEGEHEGDFHCGPRHSVPEPSTYMLMLTGLLGLGFVAWRRKEDLAA